MASRPNMAVAFVACLGVADGSIHERLQFRIVALAVKCDGTSIGGNFTDMG